MNRLLLLSLLALVSCRTPTDPATPAILPPPPVPAAEGAGAPLRITLVGTNDLHGWVMGHTENYPKGALTSGGVSAFASYMQAIRRENPDGVVLVDGGDLFQGTLMSNVTEGSVVIDAFNLLKYDAAAIGNHEFDYGPEGPVSATQPGQDAFGALKARVLQAKFPLLSANIYLEESGLRPAWLPGDGMVMLERKGLKIGIVGLTTPTTPQVTLPINVASLRFGALAPEALTAARLLREKGADLVVAVVHAGGKCGDCSAPHDLSTCDTESGEIFEMVRALPMGTLDAVVAGHTHAQIGHFVNGTPVIQSFALGRYFGLIELYVDQRTRKVVPAKTQLNSAVPICDQVDESTGSCDSRKLRIAEAVTPAPSRFRGQVIEPDAAVLAAMKPAQIRVAEMQNMALGLKVPQNLGRSYENESSLGSFLADSMREMTKADISLMNPGGLRSDLPRGNLVYGSVYEVLPFDNQVATLELSGEQLRSLLNAAFGSRKGVFQVSGLEVTLSRCRSADRLKQAKLLGGKAIDDAAQYRVVMPDFLARGGDGLSPFLATIDPKNVDLGERRSTNMRDELVAYWQKKKESFALPRTGRVKWLADGNECPDEESPKGNIGAP